MKQKRYKNQGYYIPLYYDVECSKCKKLAKINLDNKTDHPLFQYGLKYIAYFRCTACGDSKNYADIVKYKAWVKRNCPDCGHTIYKERKNYNSVPDIMEVECENCQSKYGYHDINSIDYTKRPELDGMAGDPHFGYKLWFQGEVRGNLFWGFNREHLAEIRSFVESEHRTFPGNFHRSMVSLLPKFVKESKNREAILKEIDRLLRK